MRVDWHDYDYEYDYNYHYDYHYDYECEYDSEDARISLHRPWCVQHERRVTSANGCGLT